MTAFRDALQVFFASLTLRFQDFQRRIYQYIWNDKRQGGELHTHLRRRGKAYQKRCNGKRRRGQIRNRVGIENRPAVVEEKSRIGDWEIDTMIGKGHSGALVTIVERATQFTLVASVPDKSAESVTAATIELLKPYQEVFTPLQPTMARSSPITSN